MDGLQLSSRRRLDPRIYQIASLTALLVYGWTLDFEVGLARAGAILGAVLTTQYFGTNLWKLPAFDPSSALISWRSLYLLLRCGRVREKMAVAADWSTPEDNLKMLAANLEERRGEPDAPAVVGTSLPRLGGIPAPAAHS